MYNGKRAQVFQLLYTKLSSWMAKVGFSISRLSQQSQVKSTTKSLASASGHPRAFSKPAPWLRGAVMHPGYRSSDCAQPGDSKTLRDRLCSVCSPHYIQNVPITLSS